jgi:hypothetical protein
VPPKVRRNTPDSSHEKDGQQKSESSTMATPTPTFSRQKRFFSPKTRFSTPF